MKKLYILVILLAVSGNCELFCLDNLNLGQCYDLAKKHSDSLKAQYEQQIQAEQRILEAKGLVLPQLSYYLQKTYRDTQSDLYPFESTTGKFSVYQSLYAGSGKMAAIDSTKVEAQRQALIYKSDYQNLKTQVVSAFYGIVADDVDLENVKVSQKTLEDRIKELNERIRLGKSRESEVLVVQSQIATLVAQEAQIEGDRLRNVEQLSYLTGLDLSNVKINDEIPQISVIDPIEKYLESAQKRPDLEAARKLVLSQSYNVTVAKSYLMPTLDLNGDGYTKTSLFFPGINWDVLFTLNVPLYEGGTLRGKVREADSLLRETKDQQSQLEKDITTAVRQLHLAVLSSVKQAEAYKDAYEKSEKSYKNQMRDYRYGLVQNLDVIQSISTLLDAKRNLDRSIILVKVNKLLLEIAIEN
jgi:outer membrane protein